MLRFPGENRFPGTLHYPVSPGIQHRNGTVQLRLTIPDHHKFLFPVAIQIAGDHPGVDGIEDLLRLPVRKRIKRRDPEGLSAQLPAHQKVHAGLAIQLHIFHLFKRGTIAADILREDIFSVLPHPEYENVQRLFGIAPGKDQIFIFSVRIQIRPLHCLLVVAGHGSRVFQTGHCLVNGGLQAAVLLGTPGRAVHLFYRAHGAAGQDQAGQNCKHRQYSVSQGIRPLL